MKFSREWLNDYVDLSDLSDDQLGVRLTEIGHAVEATEQHGDDTVFDLEITTNRVDAMSHIGMARELAAAIGRSSAGTPASPPASAGSSAASNRRSRRRRRTCSSNAHGSIPPRSAALRGGSD